MRLARLEQQVIWRKQMAQLFRFERKKTPANATVRIPHVV